MKAPFRSPYKLCVTQEYGNTSFNAWYKDNGINCPFHSGIDIVFDGGVLQSLHTYGTECVCPFNEAKVVKVTWDTPTSTKGNGVTIEYQIDPLTSYQVIFWHTGEIKVKVGDKIKLGDVICYIGNSGLVSPKPTEGDPWAGAHCHLRVIKYTYNGVYWVTNGDMNPRTLFDFTEWYNGTDMGFGHDLWVLTKFLATASGRWVVSWFKNKK
jgi:murein DD-endopeptidase MepM/ murein hydrolase activator NlpD